MPGPLRLRLAGKVVLVVTGVSVLAVFMAGVAYRLASGPAFQELVTVEAQSHFRSDVVEYYHEKGVLDVGINPWLARRLGEPPPAPGSILPAGPPGGHLPPPPPGQVRFGLANPAGVVILPGDGYLIGQQLGPNVLRHGTPVVIDGTFAGTILPSPVSVPLSDAQQEYANRITVALALAAAVGAVVAMGIGIVLARGIVQPIRRLTAVAREVAEGRKAQQVPSTGSDELGELAAAFNKMSEDLARYEQARRQMAADVAHELRTPLTTISGYVEAMRDGDLEPTRERLESVCRQAQRMSGVIEDLRLLAMADVGALPLQRGTVSLRELVLQTVRAHEVRASQQGVAVRGEVEGNAPQVDGDFGRLQQVVDILVNNALRHTEAGEIVVSASLCDGQAVVEVADTGSGIDPELLPRLFDRFYRGDNARQKDTQGSGLGLAIAKAIVVAHDGTIGVSSELGRGTVFTIELPAVAAPVAV
ncbi:MAG TPA: HAMP domain-containing sensor histidine kinase [Chloroflexota bacterium]|nr:HAMP domain-containing sensor histidine kinase [Chloroflexota bacterium]